MNISHIRRELKRKKSPVRFLTSRVLLRTGLCRFFRIETHGYLLHFHPSEFSCDLWCNPRIRGRETNFVKTVLKTNDTYVDVGANIGTLVLAGSIAVGPGGRVIAFEPHPRTFRFLKSNVELNRSTNVELHNCALGEREENVYFSDFKEDDVNRIVTTPGQITVPVVRLDEKLKNVGRISLMKIDVEGFEKYVIAGAQGVMPMVECLYVELSEPNFQQYGYASTEVMKLLEEYGFKLYQFIDDIVLERIRPGGKLQLAEENIVAVRSSEQFVEKTKWTLRED